ncbi:ExbD/TolR family protein [Pontiella sulfatireligans]|uniref:Biopolymer transport protein ExbD n=1 Tax=Pontiella sulfatireligans TaxID=2750658 RepID=A0A6C2UNG6_9BACT|nr:biopolymer transporter ExbD [Pontiella sulfatireligans]VGO21820.1 Biopolymer transport protein ExbD [Pontiella sulfatireligans]
MARRTSLVSLGQISDINMTPLMDLTFILLITFIITFPLIEQGVAINLPKGKAADMMDAETRSISLNLEKQLYLDDVPVSHEELASAMSNIGLNEPNTTIYVRADRKLPYGDVVEIMRVLHDANITKMALVTEADQ